MADSAAGPNGAPSSSKSPHWTDFAFAKVVNPTTAKFPYVQGPTYKIPEFPLLPESRVVQSLPFDKVGIDYFGPVYVKSNDTIQGPAKMNVWCCLITCMCIRAVHIEVVLDMSAEQFLHAIRRFVARQGKPTLIVTDNATQFRLVKKLMVVEGIKWQFIPELSPWMGEFYERMIGTVKRSMRKMIGRNRLKVYQLQTLMAEVESVVNNRPLVHVAADIESGITLTPARLMFINKSQRVASEMADTTVLDDPEYIQQMSNKEQLLQSWKRGQAYLQRFWEQWHREYLLSLRERYQSKFKGRNGQFNPKVGDIVVLKEDLNQNNWKLCQIDELEISPTDSKCRAVKLRFPNGKRARRALRMIYPLEVDDISRTFLLWGVSRSERLDLH